MNRKHPGFSIGLAAVMAILSTPANAQNALGANYNDQFADTNIRDLESSNTRWVRMFVSLPQVDRGGAGKHGVVKTILDMSNRGYKSILSLKFAYVGTPVPAVGSEAFAKDLARLDAVLPLVMGKVDILVIGAQPFAESRPEDRKGAVNDYYEALARRVIEYRALTCASGCKTRLYMGALTRLENSAERTKATDRWLEFVRGTPELDGVDMHVHVDGADSANAYLEYVLPRLRADQKFLVTDFSIVRWWEQNMTKNIPAAFADKYGAARNAQNWQIVKAALETPFSKAQWDEFLSQSPWFESRKHFLSSHMKLFRDTGKLAVAAYPFAQGNADASSISAGAAAWQLNPLFSRRTIKRNADGSNNTNYALIDDYKALQQ